MDIKLLCHCGSKFKFDWDAARDGIPSRVTCPACGLDVTLEAREVIRQLSSPPDSTPPPVPVQSVAPPPRSVPVSATPPPVPRAVATAPPAVPRPRPGRAQEKDGQDSRTTKLVVVVVLLLVLGGGGFVAWKIGRQVYSGVQAVREMAAIVKAADEAGAAEFNLTADDSVLLYVNYSNHLEVAQACTEYWKSSYNKNLVLVPEPDDDEWHPGDYPLQPAYHGYVRIMGTLEWPEAQYEGLAKFLSKRLNTLVFEERDVDFTGAYHFGVYEKGERKFHARMDIVGNEFEEKVTVENEAWALEHGFKPGAEGFQAFNIGDADAITKRLGMKLWDEPESDHPAPGFVLREQPGK